MKILILNFNKGTGGGEVYLSYLINGLIERNLQIIHIHRNNSPAQKFFKENIKNSNLYSPHCLENSLLGILEVIRLCKDVDIIHIHREHDLYFASLIKLFYGNRKKIIYSIHIYSTKKLFSSLFVDKIIANSLSVAKIAEQFFNKSKITTIYPSMYKTDIENLLNENFGKTVFPQLIMGGSFYKNQSICIKLFKKITEKYPNAILKLCSPGSGEKEIKHLEELIEKYNLVDNILILGTLKRIDYLKHLINSDCFLYTRIREPFGYVILEAALANIPIIAFSGGGQDEIIKVYNKGVLIENNDFEKFTESVLQILDNSEVQERIIDENFYENFSMENFINSHLEIYSIAIPE